MSTDDSPRQALERSLRQLANSFQASETSITGEQVAECLGHLPDTHRTALDRLFCLIYQHHSQQGQTEGQGQSLSTTPTPCSSTTPSKRPFPRSQHDKDSSQRQPESAGSRRSSVNTKTATKTAHCVGRRKKNEVGEATGRNPDRHPTASASPRSVSSVGPGSPPARPVSVSASVPAPQPLFVPALSDDLPLDFALTDTDTCINLPSKVESLLQSCKSDPSAFLRAVTDSKVSLPTGQGWKAAIATKSNNADLRDVNRIFHRFECYNIYRHVVAAGYHTGAHWIREMRPALAERLRQDFPARFVDLKAANKCLQWVDQGCRYREWAEKLSGSVVDLGYLIALPCNVPHSAYTSRCTREQIVSSVIELKRLGIDELVDKMKLSSLADHLVRSLHDMTIGEQRGHPEARLPPLIQPRHAADPDKASSSVTSLDSVLTPPELTMLDVSQCTFDAFEDTWLEEWIGGGKDDSAVHAAVNVNTTPALRSSKDPRAELSSPAMSNWTHCSPCASTDPFTEWYQQ